MKNNFQSNGKGRSQRVWQLLISMLIILTMGIGQMWGADEEIIKVVLSGSNGATKTMSGTIGGTCSVDKLSSSSPYKLNSTGAYVSLTLSTGYFEQTDVVTITGADGAHQIYYGTPTSGTLLCTTGAPSNGTITCKLWGLPANQNTIYLYRASDTYNKKVATMAVTRPDLSPTGTGTLSYTMTKGSAVVNGDVTNLNTLTPTSTSFAASTLSISSNNSKEGYCGQITGHATAYSASQYVQLGFTVASGYTFTPSATSINIFANSTSNMKAKVVISDGTITIESNELSCSSSADSEITFASGAFTDKKLSGNVTITIYQWGVTSKRAYIKSPLTITGTVAAATSVTKHSVTYALGGDYGTTPTQADVAEGAKFTLHNGTTGITAPTNKAFAGWNDGTSTYAGGAEYTMGTSDVTLTAQWSDSYSVTYDVNGASSAAPTESNKAGGAKFTLAAAPTYAGQRFMGWNDGTSTYAAGVEYTMPSANVTLTAQWSTLYAITTGTPDNGTVTAGVAEAIEGEEVTVTATPATNYMLDAWDVYKTTDSETKVSVAAGKFTMPAYAVTVSATFATDTRKKILYITTASTEGDKVYEALKDDYKITTDGPTSSKTLTDYDLVVLHESVGGGNYNADAIAAAKAGTTPVLNTKSYFYTGARWNWGTPNAGKKTAGVHVNRAYCNITDHPLFADLTPDANDSIIILSTINSDNKPIQPIGTFTTGKEGYTLANVPDGCAIHELTPAQRGATSGKYLMISLYSKDFANLNANGQKLFQNAAAYLIGNTAWEPEGPKTVTHTLTGVTTSSDEEVCAGVAYEATYVAESGYTLPASVTVKAGSTDITANCTWTQATGVLAIPAAQVTGNIQITVVGDFACPEPASGDVIFSWTPKTGLSDADIAAGTHDLPGSWLTSVNGGTAQMIVPADENMRIRGSQLAFNSNNAYVHLTICALAEGDRILVNSSNETNARNLLISLNTIRPADAEAAAAVIEQGKAYYISSTSSLKNATDLYIWRESSTTQIGEVSIIRSKKFTVTYVAADLTGGEVPAAVTDIFDGQTITVADQGTMVKGTMLFNGWKDANEVSYAAGADLEVTADMTLNAQWSQLYTVTYAKAGTEEGTVPTQESLLNGAQFTVADQGSLVTPANKVFGGWNDGTQTYEAGETYTIDGADVTLTAVWNNSYTVQYDANGGTGTMDDGTGTTVTIAANGFTYEDHKFLRWNSQPDGEGTNYAVGAEVSENLTLYAIWKEVTCTAGANIFSIEFTNTANVNMADGDADKDMSLYATIVGGSALMSYFRSGSNANVLTYGSSTSKASFGTNAQYLQLNLDCALQKGDVITIVNESGNKTAIASELTDDKYPLNGTKESTSSTNTYTVLENDNIENADVLYIGRNTSSGSLTFTAITIYRPLPDASVPTINNATPADAEYTGAASPMTVSADAEGAKDLHYQWYKEAGETDIEVGEDAASYTPIASGEYYCVVTNSPTGYAPQSATSRTATITMISSDATLAWLKADGNDIALSDGVYAYEYVIADNATVAPTITAGKNEEHAEVTITQADSKTGTATIHVVAQDGSTSHDYTVKFNEFSGCLTTFYFPYAQDAADNHVTNNAPLRGYTVFTTTQTNSSSYSGTLTVGDVDYPATKSTGSAANFGNLVVPDKYTATLYLLFRTGGSNCSVQLARAGETPTPYMTSDAYASQGIYQYNFENVQAGTYVIRVVKSNGDVQNSQYIAMAAELCRYEVTSVSLANMTLRTGNTATPEMTITPVKGAVVSQAWSFVDAAAAEAAGLSINATTGAVTATAAATPGAYTVKVVLNGDNTLSATCTVTVFTEYSQVDVTGTTEWNFAAGKAASARIDIGYGDKLLANVDGVTNDETFNSQALMVDANYVNASQLQSKSVMFHTTVPGLLTVRYACTSDKSGVNRVLYINDNATSSQTDNAEVTYTQAVPAGDVTIKAMYDNSGTPTIDIMNYKYIKFDADLAAYALTDNVLNGYTRTVAAGQYGTICLATDGVMTGGILFEIAYYDSETKKIFFDEVLNGEMIADRPYVFLPEENSTQLKVFYTEEANAEVTAGHYNGLWGTYVDLNSSNTTESPLWHNYIISNNMYIRVTGSNCTLRKNRAYIKFGTGEVPESPTALLPGRRRISLGTNSTEVATDIDNVQGDNVQCTKVMIDGQLYILRGEKMYDATGRMVK